MHDRSGGATGWKRDYATAQPTLIVILAPQNSVLRLMGRVKMAT